MPTIAIAQAPPAYLDRAATLEKATQIISAEADAGAQLIMFPEAYVPGYPTWIWRLRPGGDHALTSDLHRELVASAVDVARGDLQPVQDAARQHAVTVCLGLHEREGAYSRTTLFNSYVIIGPDGSLLNHYRKMVPTNPERMVWGRGDASGLRVVDTPVGRVGALICWGNFMPLSRQALYAQGVELYLAPTWDYGEDWIGSMRHIAREGRCWVASCATAMQASDLPDDLPGRAELYADPDEWINDGDAILIAPGGKVVAGPLHRDKGVLRGEVDASRVASARRSLDVAGHYSRPDIFKLSIDRRPQRPVDFDD